MPAALINGLAFNLSWLLIVGSSSSLLAPLVAALHVGIHLALVGKPREYLVIAAVTAFGAFLDQLLFAVGVFTVAGAAAAAPLWLSCLWPVLATTLLHAFTFLHGRWFLAATFGAVGGCASYLAGTRMTDVAFAAELAGPATLAVLWALLLPALLETARWLVSTGEVPVEA